ncbi:MAG: N-acetyltransferase [Desulfobulbaceae bacterium]|nr:N-acetyltransferase [Desulfobulbaceae bacterium]HIJ91276.1 N-acetyltransferase [Deltaproteobacteria bacterium]
MKIRELTPENYPKASALLRQAFPGSTKEVQLVENLHKNGKAVHEWVCIHINSVIAYLAFSKAYNGSAVCGLHLGPLAVKPEFQNQGVGSELLRFALRQEIIKESTIFVLGDPHFYEKFGFAPCALPICPFDTNNDHFLSIRNTTTSRFTVGYEPEFNLGTQAGPSGESRPLRKNIQGRKKQR